MQISLISHHIKSNLFYVWTQTNLNNFSLFISLMSKTRSNFQTPNTASNIYAINSQQPIKNEHFINSITPLYLICCANCVNWHVHYDCSQLYSIDHAIYLALVIVTFDTGLTICHPPHFPMPHTWTYVPDAGSDQLFIFLFSWKR